MDRFHSELVSWLGHDIQHIHRMWNNERAYFGCLIVLVVEAL